MNVLIAALGSYGDIYPMVGWSASVFSSPKRRGHDVILFADPSFYSSCNKNGLVFIPISTMEIVFTQAPGGACQAFGQGSKSLASSMTLNVF